MSYNRPNWRKRLRNFLTTDTESHDTTVENQCAGWFKRWRYFRLLQGLLVGWQALSQLRSAFKVQTKSGTAHSLIKNRSTTFHWKMLSVCKRYVLVAKVEVQWHVVQPWYSSKTTGSWLLLTLVGVLMDFWLNHRDKCWQRTSVASKSPNTNIQLNTSFNSYDTFMSLKKTPKLGKTT